MRRRLPVGAEIAPEGVHFRVWAPAAKTVELVLENDGHRTVALEAEETGYFSGLAPGVTAGALYRFRLDGASQLLPDPASRFQPDGPHGPSQVVDASEFAWNDASWTGVRLPGQVLYELHVGTFTREGTWAAAARELPQLAADGITVIEMMPVNEFAGRFGWGYDGVDLFAPSHLYGAPDDLRRFVDHAHGCGIGVILDVVYNHVGPDGNYLGEFSPDYFTSKYKNEWGEALNFDGRNSGPVREFFTANAAYWIDEFHLDGLRVDATQNIYDESQPRFLCELSTRARAAAGGRGILVIAENENQDTSLVADPATGGCGFDGLWNDDFHHALRVALTGRREAYMSDYQGSPQEVLSCLKRGYLYQGQWFGWQKKPRGSATAGVPAWAFVNYLENHDQVANTTPGGSRLLELASPASVRAATAVLLLGPGTPLLFQGQERGSRAPFTFFADHQGSLREAVAKGRRAFMTQFPSMADPEAQAAIADPGDERAKRRCVDEQPETEESCRWKALHADLLAIRKRDPVIAAQDARALDGAVLGPAAFCARFFGRDGDDRLLVVNLGPRLDVTPPAEPLLAPGAGRKWETVWSSEDARYGGPGMIALDERAWRLAADSARLLRARPGGGDAAA